MATRLTDTYLIGFIGEHEYDGVAAEVKAAHKALHDGTGLGNDFIGWLNLPTDYDKEEFARIKAAAEKIKKDTDVFVVIGIGGSYLGARAAIEFLTSQNYNLTCKDTPQIFFTGNSISSSALAEIMELCEGKDVSVNMISKSGTTTEPAIAFRVFREMLEKKYGKEGARERIYCTTDKARGTLKALADEEGYETFVVPDDVGGRFSVLTAVGLLPIAVSGADIDALMQGAQTAQKELDNDDLKTNDCYKYAAIRNILYRKGKTMEIMVSYEPAYTMMSEWFKQLFGESEGKDNKGIFRQASFSPPTCILSVSSFRTAAAPCLRRLCCLTSAKKRSRWAPTPPMWTDSTSSPARPWALSTARRLREPFWRTTTAVFPTSCSAFPR